MFLRISAVQGSHRSLSPLKMQLLRKIITQLSFFSAFSALRDTKKAETSTLPAFPLPKKKARDGNRTRELRLISECHGRGFRYPSIKKWFLPKTKSQELFSTLAKKSADSMRVCGFAASLLKCTWQFGGKWSMRPISGQKRRAPVFLMLSVKMTLALVEFSVGQLCK